MNNKKIYQSVQMLRRMGLFQFAALMIRNAISKKEFYFTYKGTRLLFRPGGSDFGVFYQLFIKEDYALRQFRTLSPAVIVDAGSNNGFSCVYFKKIFPEALLLGIEPDLENFSIAGKNTQNLKNVYLLNKALWYEETTLSLNDTGEGEYAYSITRSGESKSLIQTVTIEQLFSDYNLDRIDILKIDIEGAEKELFSNLKSDWLSKVNCLIIEFHDFVSDGCSSAVFRAIRQYDFSVSIKGENFIFFFKHHE